MKRLVTVLVLAILLLVATPVAAQHTFMGAPSANQALWYFENSELFGARVPNSTAAYLPLRVDLWGVKRATYRVAVESADPTISWAAMPPTSWSATDPYPKGCKVSDTWRVEKFATKAEAAAKVRSLDAVVGQPFAYILPTLDPATPYIVVYPLTLCWVAISAD